MKLKRKLRFKDDKQVVTNRISFEIYRIRWFRFHWTNICDAGVMRKESIRIYPGKIGLTRSFLRCLADLYQTECASISSYVHYHHHHWLINVFSPLLKNFSSWKISPIDFAACRLILFKRQWMYVGEFVFPKINIFIHIFCFSKKEEF